MEKRIRVIIGKPGLDGHDRGAKVVSRALRDAGMEVIYTGIRQTVEEIIETAIQEDADIIGLSILSGAHMKLCEKLLNNMKAKNISIPVFVGGIIPPDDVQPLKDMGVSEVFRPGTSLEVIIGSVKKIALEKEV